MAENATESITFYISVNVIHLHHLVDLRKQTNLKAAYDKDKIWITNFTADQVESVAVKSLPYKEIFYEKSGKLYPYNSLLPKGHPPALLWSPIEITLPVKIEQYNNNYFGIEESIAMLLVSDEAPRVAEIMVMPIKDLLTYAEKAPEIRLKHLEWTVLNDTKAIVFGTPILPINAEVFWVTHGMILPVGYSFELEILVPKLARKLKKDSDDWLIWSANTTYFKVPKDSVRPLSLSALRLTVKQIEFKQKKAEYDK